MRNDLQLELPNCSAITATGIQFDAALTQEVWRDIGQRICKVDAALSWLKGDWFNAGAKFVEGQLPEEKSKAVAEAIRPGFDAEQMKRIQDCAHVCERIPYGKRNGALSFGHHRVIADNEPDEQQRLLDLAEEKEWSVADLRAAVAGVENKQGGRVFFVPQKMVRDTLRWFKIQMDETPLEKWPTAKRQALKREFEPLLKILQAL